MSPFSPARGAIAAIALASFAALGPVLAQVASPGDAYPDKYPRPLPTRKGPVPPKLAVERLGEVSLPGPLKPGALRVSSGTIVVSLRDGVAVVPGDPAAAAEVRERDEAIDTTEQTEWVVSPGGGWRFRAEPSGRIVAEKRRSESSRWRRAWRLRVAGGTPSPPLLVGRRLLFASLDDQVYCVRADNGHRIWATDLGERVSRTPILWRDHVGGEDRLADLDLLLVVPDGGGALVALDAYDGRTLARLSLPRTEGWFVSPPVVLENRDLAIARQGYDPSDAGLAFYGLRPADPTPPDPPNSDRYNDRSFEVQATPGGGSWP